MAYRVDRVNELIKAELTKIINYELSDPRLDGLIIGVTRARTTPDIKYSKVYISILGDQNKRDGVMLVLDKAKGFMKKKLASVLTTKFAPELIFVLDDSVDDAMHIEKILQGISYNDDEI